MFIKAGSKILASATTFQVSYAYVMHTNKRDGRMYLDDGYDVGIMITKYNIARINIQLMSLPIR